jgi:hypothetical protein
LFLVFFINQIRITADFCLTAMVISFKPQLTVSNDIKEFPKKFLPGSAPGGEEIATKAPRHKVKLLVFIDLRGFGPPWRN